VLDVEDRLASYKEIETQSWRAEHGIRSICVMYDDHSDDKNSKENIFLLKDNVHYRLFSLVHQYLIFLRELGSAEDYLKQLHKKDPQGFNSFLFGNPYFEKVELELSSVFDSIVFQLSSVFDYLSHLICYICKKNKSNTLYWTKLASTARGQNNEFSNLDIRNVIDSLDRSFIGKLYDYRSRLLHNRRDKHEFTTELKFKDLNFNIKVLASDDSLKHFKLIRSTHPNEDITLTYLSYWLVKQSFIEIEKILDGLRNEILKNSSFHLNLRKPKAENGFMIVSVDPSTNFAQPVSEGLWKQYKEMK